MTTGPTCSEWTVSLLLMGKDREMVVIGVGVVAGEGGGKIEGCGHDQKVRYRSIIVDSE